MGSFRSPSPVPAMLTDTDPRASALRSRPAPDEHTPYFARYVNLVTGDDVMDVLTRQVEETIGLLGAVGEDRGNFRYAPGKWSIKEVAGHMIDTERVMAYRALWAARGDRAPLPGFEQDDFVRGATFDGRTLRDLIDELRVVRLGSLALFRPLTDEELLRRGIANDAEFTPRAIAFIIAGHERHHLVQLRERYGLS